MLQRAVRPAEPGRQVEIHDGNSISGQIDALCGVVILLSLLSAYTCTYDKMIGHARPLWLHVNLGYLSLQMFFAIAAYQLLREVSGHGDWMRYIRARFVRFVPAVIPAVLLTYALVTEASIPQLHADANALLANLVMMADFFGMPDFDGAFWRLKIEVMFAVALGVVWFGLGARSAIGVLLAGLALCAWQAHGDPVHQKFFSGAGFVTMDGYLPNLTAGLSAFFLAQQRHRAVWWIVAGTSGAIVLASNTPQHGMMVLAAYLVVGVAAHGGLPMLARFGWLAATGRAFFSIYLLHQALGFVLIHGLEARGVPALLAVTVACGAAILCGAAMHRCFTRAAHLHLPRLLGWTAAEFARQPA